MNDEAILLLNLYECFNRILNRSCEAIEVQALLFAIAKAMAFSEFDMDFENAAADILETMRAGASREEQHEAAVRAIKPLYTRVSQAWGKANERQLRWPPKTGPAVKLHFP